MKNRYTMTGLVLLIVGAYISGFAYFALASVPLTAIGLSTVVLGITSLGLAKSAKAYSTELSKIFMQAETENITAILKELGINQKAIYFPRKAQNGRSQVFIPLTGEFDIRKIKEVSPGQFISACMPGWEGMAVAVTTPGNMTLEMLRSEPGHSTGEMESAMDYILTRVLDIADTVSVVPDGSQIHVEVNGVDILPWENEENLYYQCLGSPLASVAAAVCCEAYENPVRISEESNHSRSRKITLEVLA